MSELATSFRAQMNSRGYNQTQTSVCTGVAQGPQSQILRKDHIPEIGTPVRLAGRLPRAGTHPRGQHPDLDIATALAGTEAAPPADEIITRERIHQFRQVPDEWKQEVVALIRPLCGWPTSSQQQPVEQRSPPMPNRHQRGSQPRSPDPAWDTECEQAIRPLPPPHRPAVLNYLRNCYPSTRLSIHIDQTGTNASMMTSAFPICERDSYPQRQSQPVSPRRPPYDGTS